MDEYKILREFEEAKEDGTLPEMPEALDTKCRELIDEAFGSTRRRARVEHIGTAVKRAAMVVLILFGLSSALVLSVDAFRVPVLNYLVGRNEEYVSINSGEIVYPKQTTLKDVIQRVNSSIPEGYEQISCVQLESQYSVAYQDSDNHVIIFSYAAEYCNIGIDTENTAYASMEFGDFSAVFSRKDGCRLIWEDTQSKVFCMLFADGMDETEFWEFAYLLIS